MSKFSTFFIHAYPKFKQKVLAGDYKEALVIYMAAYKRRVEGKKNHDSIHQTLSAAYDGFNRHGSRRERDLRTWVEDDDAFDGFLHYFEINYGKNGVNRISNKSKVQAHNIKTAVQQDLGIEKKKTKEEGPYEQFLHRKQLRAMICGLVKNNYLEKKELFEKIDDFIKNAIIFPSLKELTDAVKKDLVKEKENYFEFGGSPFLVNESASLGGWLDRVENIESSVFNLVFNYLRWYAARYLNKKGRGKNVPTNSLTIALKRNPILYLILSRQEKKFFLHSFLFGKKKGETLTESYNVIFILHDLYPIYSDDTLEKISVPKSLSGAKTIKDAKCFIQYRKKVIDLFEKLKPAYKYLDTNVLSAIELILKCRNPFLILLPQDKVFIDNNANIDVHNKEECLRVLMRLVGIYTISSRIKYMNRFSYYDYYRNQHDTTTGEVGWMRRPDPELEYFIFSKDGDYYYDFDLCWKRKYKSYIDTVEALYPREEYVYIKPDYIFPVNTSDTYLTPDGYTLARYNYSGELCTEPLKGNFVKRINDPNFIPEHLQSFYFDKLDEYFDLKL